GLLPPEELLMTRSRRSVILARWSLAAFGYFALAVACSTMQAGDGVRQRLWWSGFGPVMPHDTFPAECSLCHVGQDWQSVREDFHFDHKAQTGVPLNGAHARASCIRCHNDRGPVATFSSRGCGGCHEDIHTGELGTDCTRCHQEVSWEPVGQYELHYHTRFPLTG